MSPPANSMGCHQKVHALTWGSIRAMTHLSHYWTTTQMSSFLESSIISQISESLSAKTRCCSTCERRRKGNVAVRYIPYGILVYLYLITHTTAFASLLLFMISVCFISYSPFTLCITHIQCYCLYTRMTLHSTHMIWIVLYHTTCISSAPGAFILYTAICISSHLYHTLIYVIYLRHCHSHHKWTKTIHSSIAPGKAHFVPWAAEEFLYWK